MLYLLKHCHLVIDHLFEYLDGSILIEDERIVKVFDQSSLEVQDAKIIDIKNNLVIPSLFDISLFDDTNYYGSYLLGALNDDNLLSKLEQLNNYDNLNARFLGVNMKGPFYTHKYPLGQIKEYDEEYLNKIISNKLVKIMNLSPEIACSDLIVNKLKENNIKVFCGNSDIDVKDFDLTIDGISELFKRMRHFDHQNLSLVNLAFSNDYYVELNCFDMDKEVLKLVINNIDHNKIILSSGTNQNDLFKQIRVLKTINVNNNDIVAFSSINAYRLLNMDKQYGGLYKGKYADILICDDNYQVLNAYIKGEFINENFLS